jgi:hypothetical protein
VAKLIVKPQLVQQPVIMVLDESLKDNSMRRNNFVTLCLRILGIYFGVFGLSSLPNVISMFFEHSNLSAYFYISPIILITCGTILFIFASNISQYIIDFSEAEESGFHVTVSEQTTRIALLILGIFIFVQALPQLIQLSFDVGLYYINLDEIPEHLRSSQPRWTYLIGPLIKLIMGATLIIGPDKIISVLSRYDETFKKIKSSNISVEQDEQ